MTICELPLATTAVAPRVRAAIPCAAITPDPTTIARRVPVAMGAAAIALLSFGTQLSAAQGRLVPDSVRQIQSLVPRSGPPGTLVSIHTKNLPLQTKVLVGVGAIGAGFEELGETLQGEWGEVSVSVRVPESASWDQALIFILFNSNFIPTGLSEPFHVTDTDGRVRRKGRITDESEACAAMRDEDDYFYTLTGDLGGFEPGDEVVVEGVFVASGVCPQGNTIRVSSGRCLAARGIVGTSRGRCAHPLAPESDP